MRNYTERTKVKALIPDAYIVEACDDDGDGVEDEGIFDTVVQVASEEVDGYLQGRYGNRMPWTAPFPDLVATTALYLTCEALYTRRPGAEVPPKIWRKCSELRASLRKIRDGDANLDVVQAERGDDVLFTGEPSRLTLDDTATGYFF
jgi:phage gp36-like protein